MSILNAGALLIATVISTADLRKEFPVSPRDEAIVRDAVARWVQKAGPGEAAMDNRVPLVVYLARQRCVVLQLRATDVGGTPTYCYDLQKDAFIEASDDVE